MKALIRNMGETITEDMNVFGVDWETGAPLTNPYWSGGSYTLIDDYDPSVGDSKDSNITELDTNRNAEIAELRARLATLENDL